MTRQQVLDLSYMEARAKLIDLGAFMDRFERAEGSGDFRYDAFKAALAELSRPKPDRAKRILLSLSDPTVEPIAKATTKAACGAWPGLQSDPSTSGGAPVAASKRPSQRGSKRVSKKSSRSAR